ncbi:hypothetical protein HDC92_001556 [Pedobacter sp. AK017]|uniref:DUF6266 family protein n=1 Tax=Pedobacter sp. AK017 TaxID=2723073 RepID=UPI001617FE58|nr:DUF6266 family protein [Pedobacter sp. AK017]MBB5437882.1 hypothetical protein [Pedobacter sp. AK017]
MGHLTGGPYYDLIGRTGNNVGRRRKGKNVFSMRPAKSNKPPSALQLAQRNRFGLVTSWLSRIGDLIDAGFLVHPEEESDMNAAVSYHLKNAVTGVSPNFTMDYPKVMFSRGKVGEAYRAEVNITVAARLDYVWLAGTPTKYNKPTDMATVMVYCPALDKFVTLQNAAARSALLFNLLLPGNFSGEEVHAYIGFTSADGKVAGSSVYVGEFLVL